MKHVCRCKPPRIIDNISKPAICTACEKVVMAPRRSELDAIIDDIVSETGFEREAIVQIVETIEKNRAVLDYLARH